MRRSISVVLAFASVGVLLGGCGGGGGGGGNNGVITFTASSYSVNEDGSVIDMITLHREGGGSTDVSVTVTLTDGSATAPSDYDATPIIVAWLAGDLTDKVIAVPIVNDPNDEPDEFLTMTIGSPTGGAVVGTPGSATLTIVDNDVAGTVQFDFSNYFYGEDGGTGSPVTVTRTGGMDGDISVTVVSTDDTANSDPLSLVEPVDYSPVSVSVFFADQSTTPVVVALSIVDDLLPEINESFDLALINPTNGATLGSPSSASVLIIDNDNVLQIDNPGAKVNGFAGTSVARIGQRLAIGAPGNLSGAGEVFSVDVDFGMVHHTSNGGPFAQGFGGSLSSVGNTLGIGGTGAAWSFGGDSFLTFYSERFSVSNADDGFGSVVHVHGGRLVVGAPAAQIGGSLATSGRIYSYDAFNGSPFPVLDGAADNRLGSAFASLGGDLLAGAPGNDGMVVKYAGSPWAVDWVINNPFPQSPSNAFGHSVAVNAQSGAVMVGAPDGDTFAPDDGRVHLFDGGPPATILAPGPALANGRFGANVLALSDGRICVQQAGGNGGTGRIWVFDSAGVLQGAVDSPVASVGANFGASMCELDGVLAVGAPNFPAIVQSGTVFIVKLP